MKSLFFMLTMIAALSLSVEPALAQAKVKSTNVRKSGATNPGADGGRVQPSSPVAASPGDTKEAIQSTQDLLESPEARKEQFVKDPNAKRADDMVNRITGGNESLNQGIYELASKVFARIAEQANGDPKVMQELLLKFQRDPASFAGSWTSEERAKLKEIADQMQSPAALPK